MDEGNEGDESHAELPHVNGRAWPDPGAPPDNSSAAVVNRYAVVGYLVDQLRIYAGEYYSSNRDYRDGYRAGMRKSAGALVNWLKGKGLWDR